MSAAPAPAPGALRAIAAIAVNEVRRTARERVAMLFIVVLPVVIILIIGTTFGSTDTVDIGVLDLDGTPASASLVAALDRREGVTVDRYDQRDTLRRDVRLGSVAAGLVVPAGYGDAVDRDEVVVVEMIADPSSTTAAAAQATVRAAVGDAAVEVAAAGVVVEAAGITRADADRRVAEVGDGVARAGVRSETVDEGDGSHLGTFSYTAPSNLVLFTFVNTVVVGSVLALERRQGITRRMLATPHGTGTILAGIGAAKLLFALLQSTLIVVVGTAVFGVSWGDPAGAALLIVLFAAVATAVGLLVGATLDGPDQAQALGIPVAIALGMLGGCMWPLEIVPPVMRTIGHVAPHAWAMDAWIDLIFVGEGVGGIAVDLGVLAAYAVVLGLLARWRLLRALTT